MVSMVGGVPDIIIPHGDPIEIARGGGEFMVEVRQGDQDGRRYVHILIYENRIDPENHPDYYASCRSKTLWIDGASET